MSVLLRARGNPMELAGALRAQVRAIDPDQPVASLQTMEQVLSTSLRRPRFTVVLLGVFASVGLLLAVVGIYGVISYLVGQRTHEIGVRMALGARAGDILGMILAQGAWLALVGIALGLGAALAAARFVENLLFNLPATDPLTFAGISLLLEGRWLSSLATSPLDAPRGSTRCNALGDADGPLMMLVVAVGESHQESGVGNPLHGREKPLREERLRAPRTTPARRMKCRLDPCAFALSS